jgi:chromosome segregation ATPase
MEEDKRRGESSEDTQSTSGWVTTDIAARALRVTPRTIRTYIGQGKLEAEPQGEGVRKSWLVSIDSLQAMRDARGTAEYKQRNVRESASAKNAAEDLFLEIANRLEIRAAEVGELRTRLEITERAESTLREERRRLIEDLNRERKRAEEAQQVIERLKQESLGVQQEAQQLRAELDAEQSRGFWRKLFGG